MLKFLFISLTSLMKERNPSSVFENFDPNVVRQPGLPYLVELILENEKERCGRWD